MPLNVILIASACDANDVGEAWYAYQWASRLGKRFSATVLAIESPEHAGQTQKQLPHCRVLAWQNAQWLNRFERLNAMAKPGYIGFFVWARRTIQNILEERPIDLIHQFAPFAPRYPSPAAGLGVPFIMGPVGGSVSATPAFQSELSQMAWYTKFRALDRFRFRHDPLLRNTYASADAVLGAAPYVHDILAPVKMKQFLVHAETGVADLPDLSSKKPHTPNALNLLFVGRVVRSKGVRDAVRALAHLADLPNITLDVVGDGDDLPNCKQEADTLNVAHRIRFHGKIKRAAVDAFYLNADAFLFPSLREASGTAVLEAMSFALPMIVADAGGPASSVTPACGFRIPPLTPTQYATDLAAAIRTLATHPEKIPVMGAAARQRIATTYLWDRKVDFMANLYDKILAPQTTV